MPSSSSTLRSARKAALLRRRCSWISTDDRTHGDQEGSYYHGYYGQHIYHPLLVFDGQSGHLICALLLRAGNTHMQATRLWPS
jgi:hypothetical protein